MYKVPSLVYANEKGEIFDHPTLKMAVRTASYDMVPYETELIRLPPCSRLYYMPGTVPIAYDPESAKMTEFAAGRAVSVFLPPGYLRLFLPAYKKTRDYVMPLFAYTAVGFLDGHFVVPALLVDDASRWNPDNYDYSENFERKTADFLKSRPRNRLYDQLAVCATKYHCTAAKNVFYPRWECPIPVSPSCNASCLGCISLQPAECCPSPQQRLNFRPAASEITEVALFHASRAEDPIISFGQGCEGDPIMAASEVAEAVKRIKKEAPGVTVNFNSNCSVPDNLKRIIDSGVDSVRMSLNSAVEKTYLDYYSPRSYSFADILESARILKDSKVFFQLNLLTFPGVNDRVSETNALIDFINEYEVDLIQTRNLNIDAELLCSVLKFGPEEILGIKNMLRLIKKKRGGIKFGYFNRKKEDFGKDFGYPDLKPPKKRPVNR